MASSSNNHNNNNNSSPSSFLATWTTDSHCSYHGDTFAFQLGLSHDCHVLFDTSSFSLHRGKVTGLVGTNGSGKTSLSRVIESKQLPGFPSDLTVSYLPSSGGWEDNGNNDSDDEETLLQMQPQEYLQHCVKQRLDTIQQTIDELENQLEDDPTSEDLVERLSELYDVLDTTQESAEREMQQMLVEELGFTPSHLNKALSQLSSGWRYKVRLVSVLLARPCDLLLIDEPSFLDTASTEWLVNRLSQMAHQENAMVILVSHKEALLDQLCDDHILFINAANKTLTQYHCSYSAFRELHASQVESSRKTMDAADQKVAGADQNLQHLQAKLKKHEKHFHKITAHGEDKRFIKGKCKEQKQKADRVAASKLKQLKKHQAQVEENLHQQAIADRVKPIKIPGVVAASDLAVLENASVSYGDEYVLCHVDLRLEPTDRVLLKGENGVGKTTLIKTLLGELEHPAVAKGTIRLNGTQNKSLYFPQTALHDLVREHGSETATDFLHAHHPHLTETRLRQHLGDFGLTSSTALRKIATLSAGQQVRLWLAHRLLQQSEVSLLVLDEISENVDVESRQSLVDLVNSWEGAAIVVSHDPDFCQSYQPTQIWHLMGQRGMRIEYPDR